MLSLLASNVNLPRLAQLLWFREGVRSWLTLRLWYLVVLITDLSGHVLTLSSQSLCWAGTVLFVSQVERDIWELTLGYDKGQSQVWIKAISETWHLIMPPLAGLPCIVPISSQFRLVQEVELSAWESKEQIKENPRKIFLPVSYLFSLSSNCAGGSYKKFIIHIQIFCCSTYANLWPRGPRSWSVWGCEQKYSLIIWPSSRTKALEPPCAKHLEQSRNQRRLPITSQQTWQLREKEVSLF